jgi:MFS family permease
MILLNGVSFLYAAATQLFMKIPRVTVSAQKKSFMRDLADGIKYTFGRKGLRTLMITCTAIDFFAAVGLTLFIPLFNSTPGFGVKMYGYMMGAFTLGAVLGMVVLSAVKIRASQRSALFGCAIVAMVAAMIPIGFLYNVYWLFPLAFVAGVSNAIVNMLIQTITQATVPSESRGRVFGILGTVSGALMPLAMAASGVVAQFAGVRPTIIVSFALLAVSVLPLLFGRHFKKFINTDLAAPADAGNTPEGAPDLFPDASSTEEA